MLNQSREFNMLACLLAALASGSFARFHCDVCSTTFFLHAQKRFRHAARFVLTLAATEQLHMQVLRTAYSHLAAYTSYG